MAYYVCNSVHSVMREMLLAAECGVLGGDIFTRLCQQLYSRLAVCVSAGWPAPHILGGGWWWGAGLLEEGHAGEHSDKVPDRGGQGRAALPPWW